MWIGDWPQNLQMWTLKICYTEAEILLYCAMQLGMIDIGSCSYIVLSISHSGT